MADAGGIRIISAAIVSSLYLELRALKEGDVSSLVAGIFE